jgi:hypothetical protein
MAERYRHAQAAELLIRYRRYIEETTQCGDEE